MVHFSLRDVFFSCRKQLVCNYNASEGFRVVLVENFDWYGKFESMCLTRCLKSICLPKVSQDELFVGYQGARIVNMQYRMQRPVKVNSFYLSYPI